MAKQTQRHFIARVQDIPGTFRTMEGGGAEADVTRDYNGGSEVPDLLGGIPEHENIELVRTVDELADSVWLNPLRHGVGKVRRTISRQATDANMVAIGKATVWPNCLLVGFAEVETDAASSDPAEVTLTWATSGPAK